MSSIVESTTPGAMPLWGRRKRKALWIDVNTNAVVKQAAADIKRDLKDAVHWNYMVDTGNFERSIDTQVKKQQGIPTRISIVAPRYGFLLEHGVGRGRKAGTPKASQYKRHWLTPVLRKQIPRLAEALGEQFVEMAENYIRLYNV